MENFPLNKDEYIALEIAKLMVSDSFTKSMITTADKTNIFMKNYLEILEYVKNAQHKEPKARSL